VLSIFLAVFFLIDSVLLQSSIVIFYRCSWTPYLSTTVFSLLVFDFQSYHIVPTSPTQPPIQANI